MSDISYGKLRYDETFQYRSVKVEGTTALAICNGRLLSYSEWSKLGIKLSKEWQHISTHVEGRNVMLFRRPIPPKDELLQEVVYINEYELEKYKGRKQ